MASSLFQFDYFYERDVVNVIAKITIGATGAPTLTQAKGIASITRNSAGNYTVALKDRAYLFLGMSCNFLVAAAAAPAAPIVTVVSETVNSSSPAVVIQCFDADTPAATDPAEGEIMLLQLQVRLAST